MAHNANPPACGDVRRAGKRMSPTGRAWPCALDRTLSGTRSRIRAARQASRMRNVRASRL